MVLRHRGERLHQKVNGGQVTHTTEASNTPRAVGCCRSEGSLIGAVLKDEGLTAPCFHLLLEAGTAAFGDGAAGRDDQVRVRQALPCALLQPAAGEAPVEPVGCANFGPRVAQVVHVKHGRNALLAQPSCERERVGIVTHHEVRLGSLARSERALAEGAQAAQRGETGPVRVHAEVMPHDVDAVHRCE